MLDPAEDVRKRCMKNSPSVLSCIGRRGQEKAVTVAAKSGQFTADETWKQSRIKAIGAPQK